MILILKVDFLFLDGDVPGPLLMMYIFRNPFVLQEDVQMYVNSTIETNF